MHGRLLRSVVWFAVVLLSSFLVHRTLRGIYYQRCDYDIIQVVFFKNSQMCMFLKAVIDIIEHEYAILLRGVYDFLLRT